MGQLAMVFAGLPMAGGPLAAAVLVLHRRHSARPSRASRRFAEELRAVADVLPRVRPISLPVRRAGGTDSVFATVHTCRPCREATVPAPRRPPAPVERPDCALCAR
ncbi:hypothetical protein [Amycolatopsis sp. NPDC051903]|uniref:hypothetical protein n=1 Tax=Amycolatopsis sp. NPDC051903 TaxID=3363936 RepID=UPI0037B6A2AF